MAEYKLSQEEVDELQEVFNLFDKGKTGKVPVREIGPIMLSLNQKDFRDSEAQEMIRQLDPSGSGSFGFKAFCELIAMKMGVMDKTADVIAAFQTFDKDLTGSVSTAQLRHILTKLGDPLNESELKAFMEEAGTGDRVEYEALTKRLMA